MRVLLADDQVRVRSALRLYLEQEPGIQIVGEAADATGLLQAIVEKAPDLVLLDWELPGLPAAQLLRLLRYERPSLKVTSMSSQPEAYQASMAAGVQAFVSKSEPPERVLASIQALVQIDVNLESEKMGLKASNRQRNTNE
jgi:DNA-binding NarL/FixJ family response regulator